MQVDCYFGTYARFDTASKKDAAILLGADNLVGDVYEIVFQSENGISVAWLKNRFDQLVGFFDPSFSRQLSIMKARGWTLKALLSFVAFTDSPEPGSYWGEAAILCFDSHLSSVFEPFIASTSQRLSDGVRPDINLGEQGVDQVISSKGSWKPQKTVPFPDKTSGTAIVKSRRKLSEKMIEQGRKGNKGCYVVSWAFLALIAIVILIGLKSCNTF